MHKREMRCTNTPGRRRDGAAHLLVTLDIGIQHQEPTTHTFRCGGVHDETGLRSGACRRRLMADRRRSRRHHRHPCLWCTWSSYLTGTKRLETALTFISDHLAFRAHSATLHSATAIWRPATIRHLRSNGHLIAVFRSLSDVVEVKTVSRSTAYWWIHFIRLNGWLRHSFAKLITLLDIDGIGQNWEDSNIIARTVHQSRN